MLPETFPTPCPCRSCQDTPPLSFCRSGCNAVRVPVHISVHCWKQSMCCWFYENNARDSIIGLQCRHSRLTDVCYLLHTCVYPGYSSGARVSFVRSYGCSCSCRLQGMLNVPLPDIHPRPGFSAAAEVESERWSRKGGIESDKQARNSRCTSARCSIVRECLLKQQRDRLLKYQGVAWRLL